ncbi:MAG: hypothetical protein SPE59_02765 [Treponema sp.]|nr:hypothetical protein [Treponema sp.]
MKKTIFILFLIFITFSLIACKSTDIAQEKTETTEFIEEVVEVDEVDEVVEVIDDAEYLRSIDKLAGETVSRQEFEDDKAQILQIINELSKIMEKEDYEAWRQYIAPDSLKYYSNPQNIRKAQKKLPDKTIKLAGTKDYFKYVFIPSRKRSQVDEIRYISKENIKAVQVKSDDSVIIYYYFIKVNGKWMVQIPPLN